MARIFISYKRANKEQVFPIVDYIEQQLGVKCWVDLDGIESSAQFASVICNAIDATDVVLFMHSLVHLNIDFENDWTIKEHNYAVAKKKRIILVKLDDAPLDNIFLMEYGSKNNIDSRIDAQMQKLLKDLRVWLKLSKTHDNILSSSPDELVISVKTESFKMKKIEGGTFMMGAQRDYTWEFNYDSKAYIDESPVHQVTLNDFYIGEFLLTQGVWESVMNYSGEVADGSSIDAYESDIWLEGGPSKDLGIGKNYPMYYVCWDDIVNIFIPRLNKITGKKFRLPTEAEWEFAARGGNKSRGYKYSGSNTLQEVAWYEEHVSCELHEVGSKAPNELGLYDMSGNVWEWCNDLYGGYSDSVQINPTGPTTGYNRVFRGGSHSSSDHHCRVSNRLHDSPYTNYYYRIGFRLALDSN